MLQTLIANRIHNAIYFCNMLIGYARVSKNEQDASTQVASLEAAGCEMTFHEKASGGRWDRPELHRLLGQLRKGDVVVVWKLDRLSRSLKDVLTIMERVQKGKAGFRSLTELIDTTTPAGRMMMQMIGSSAEFERELYFLFHYSLNQRLYRPKAA
jgi:DNA invertase Pin-like site-specific DNA recombinase